MGTVMADNVTADAEQIAAFVYFTDWELVIFW